MTAMPERTSRYDYPLPEDAAALRLRILYLMLDGVHRSEVEIRHSLRTEKAISPHIREMRQGKFGAPVPFNSPRSEGPEADGIYRYFIRTELPNETAKGA